MKDFFQLREELQLREETSRIDHFKNVAKNHDEKASNHEKTSKDAYSRRHSMGKIGKQSKSYQSNSEAHFAHTEAARLARKVADTHYKDPDSAAAATHEYNKAAAKAKQHSNTANEHEAEEARNKGN